MNCPNCQTPNPDNARFCLNCGTSLSVACANCGTSLPAGAKFCFTCGQAVGAPAPVARPEVPPAAAPHPPVESRLQQFIPRELLAKLEASRASGGMEGERRIVTMLFCDVKGSTAAAGQLDPEEWAEIINGAFEHMITPVYRYEGTVARLMGDGILAFFGAPIAHEDDPQRAVLASLAIVEAIHAHRDAVMQRWGIDLDVRVGVNTGLVVVGAVGSDLRMEYTALGDAINLAARMEQTAMPGTVQIAESTYKLVAPLFDVETLDGVEIKGKAEPVRAYRVLGRKATPGALRGIAGLRSPLVGREREAAALWTALESVQAGRGQIVAVMGEAGLGKSRLISEVRDAVALDPTYQVRWLEGRLLSYETGTPFAPFADLLGGYFGFQPGGADGDDVKYRLIRDRLAQLFDGQAEAITPFLASLFGLSIPEPDAERVRFLEPPMLRAGIFAQVAGLIGRLADEQPLVIVLDDVHWIDPTSLELLESLLPLTERAGLLLIVAFRPRREEPSWRLHELAARDYPHRYTAVALQPLDQSQARELVANLLHVEDLPERVRQLILDKSEGNPFFVEEVIRSLLDSGLVVRQDDHWRATADIVHIAVPDTLAGVIAARLDRLDDATRQIVQAAAVVGRDFSYDTLADVLEGTNGRLEPGIAELLRRQLAREKSMQPRRVYTFKHVLTQEAAYNSILLSRRRDLHRRAAESLVQRSPEQAADIARHFLEARQPARAMPYLVAAGDRAARNYASQEAIEHFRKALEIQAAVEDLASVRMAYEGLGRMLTLTGQVTDALATYEAMLDLAERRADVAMKVSALNKLAYVSAVYMGLFAEGETYLARAERLSQEFDEHGGAAESALIRCQMCTFQADFDGVVHHMGDLVAIGQTLDSQEFQAMGLEHVSSSLMFLTRFDEAWEKGLQALAVSREAGDRIHEASALTMTLPMCLMRNGRFDEAAALARDGVAISRRIGGLEPVVFGNWCLAEIHRWRGEYEQAIDYGRQSLDAGLHLENFEPFMTVQPLGALGSVYLEISPRFHDQISRYHLHALKLLEHPFGMMGGGAAWADVGWCALALGDEEIAGACFEKGLHHPSMFMLLERPRHLAGSALLSSRQGRHAEALALAEEACIYADERAMRHVLPLTRFTLGRALASAGQHAAALAEFAVASGHASELSMRPAVWQAQAASARSLRALGRSGQADEQLAAALATIGDIAGLFTDQTLAAEFRKSAVEQAKA